MSAISLLFRILTTLLPLALMIGLKKRNSIQTPKVKNKPEASQIDRQKIIEGEIIK